MLKIKKTKPYQFRKSRGNSTYKIYAGRVACALALICSIVPTLALLTYYDPYAEKTYAADKSLSDINNMQEMRTSICENSTIGESNALTDTRDNSTYTVSKLNDGKCWMTQNLRITKESVEENGSLAILDNSQSNIGAGNDFSLPTADINSFTDNTRASIYYAGDEIYGAYYSWCAATAGSCQDVTTAGINASDSICPRGWRLPTQLDYVTLREEAGEWTQKVINEKTYEGRTFRGSFWVAAGTVGSDAILQYMSNGYYWSSTASSEEKAYNLYFLKTGTNPAASNNRLAGRTIRCVAESWPSKDVDVIAVVVPPVISIDATSGMNKEVDPNLVTKGEISATISANTTYAVQLSANKTSLTNPNSSEEPTPTNSIPASSNVQAKTNAWGILNSDNTTYSAITTNPTAYYNTESANEDSSKTHTFTLGVSVSPTLPAGEYSTTVTITAVNN